MFVMNIMIENRIKWWGRHRDDKFAVHIIITSHENAPESGQMRFISDEDFYEML